MGVTYEWFTIGATAEVVPRGATLGVDEVDGECAVVIDNGGGAAVIEGDFTWVAEVLRGLADQVVHMQAEALAEARHVSAGDFWVQIGWQLDRIERDKPDTFEQVREVLLDKLYGEVAREVARNGERNFGPNAAFFAGSGGDRQLLSSLIEAGWRVRWRKASYWYSVSHPDSGDVMEYIEGDLVDVTGDEELA